MDSASIWMGEQTDIRLEMTQDRGQQVMLPIVSDTLTAGIEVLHVSRPDTIDLKNNRIQINNNIHITSFDSGLYYIPPFRYVIDDKEFETQSLSLKVVPVEVDTTMAEFDIKTIQAPPFVITDYVPTWCWYLLLALLLVAGGIYGYIYWRKRRTVAEQVDERMLIPAHERAMNALLALKEDKLWQNGQDKEYYTRLTDILREYIDERFEINAMEMTSSQILESLRKNETTKTVNASLKEILEVADFVKFAKMRPIPDDNEMAMRNAIRFVEATVPEEQPDSDAKPEEKAEPKKELSN